MANSTISLELERELVGRYKGSLASESVDLDARNLLVELHLPLIRWAAKSIHSANLKHTEVDELVSVGCMGMIKGLERFDQTSGNRVSTYCLWWIKAAMHDHVREVRWNSYVPEVSYRQLMKMHKAISKMPVEFNGQMNINELARVAGIPEADCHKLYALTKAIRSIETPISKNGKLKLGDILRQPDAVDVAYLAAQDETSELVREGLGALPEDLRQAIDDKFFLGSVSGASPQRYTELIFDSEGAKKMRDKALRKLKNLPCISKAHELMQSFEAK